MAATRYPVRYKGVSLGQLTGQEITERLRTGELSLAHVIELRGRWMTLRQFLRETEPTQTAATTAPTGGLLGRLTGRTPPPPPGADQPPPPPGSAVTGADPFDSQVREGYLWCGLTFLLPALVGLPAWGLCHLAGLKPVTTAVLWSLSGVAGAAYATWRALACVRRLHDNGLEDVGGSMRSLAFGLSALSCLFWIVVAFKWTGV